MPSVTYTGNVALTAQGWSGWTSDTWDAGISPFLQWNGVGYDIVPVYDAQLIVFNSGPLAGMMIRLMGPSLSITGNFGSDQPTPLSGTITGFRIYDRYEHLLTFDDPNNRILSYDYTSESWDEIWDGQLVASVSDLSIDAAALQLAGDLAAALLAAISGGADQITGSAAREVIDGGAGNDTINAGGANDTVSGSTGNDFLRGQGGSDRIAGDFGSDRMFGDGGNDLASGGTGQDTIYGGSGNDTLRGDGGGDRMFGGTGNDLLVGGAGTDVMTGDSGGDRFVFARPADIGTGAGSDRITDFVSGQDVIVLSGIDANTTLGGNQAFDFVTAGGFGGAAGELVYLAGGRLAGDVDGDGTADFTILLVGTPALVEADIVL